MDITKLPDHVLQRVLKELHPKDVLSMRQTGKRLAKISHTRDVWLYLLCLDWLDQQSITRECFRPFEEFSGAECEALVLRNMCLRKNLTSTTSPSPLISTMNGARSITWVRLVQGRWFLVASSDQSSSVLSLWHVPALFAEPLEELPIYEAFLEGPVKNGFVEVQEGRIIIALELRPLLRDVVVVFTMMEVNGRQVLESLARHEGISHLRALQGSYLAVALHMQRSIPSLVNWRTGEVVNLLRKPDALGGAIAMAVSKDTVAVVSPKNLRIFALQDSHAWVLAQIIDIPHSIGYAAIQFLPPRIDPDTGLSPNVLTELNMAIAGQEGLFLYKITRAPDTTASFHASLVWHRTISRNFAHYPAFGQGCKFLSWIEGDTENPSEINFHAVRLGFEAEAVLPAPSVFKFALDSRTMPAMYGMGVFDYDGALGFAAFGNMFGELAVADLSGVNVSRVIHCFKDLQFEASDHGAAAAPNTPVPVTFHPPFPYLGGHRYPDFIRDQIFAHWKSYKDYPRGTIQEVWGIEGTSNGYAGPTWLRYVPIFPDSSQDRAWLFEHARHIYGTIIPLVSTGNQYICYAGGLLYLFFGDDVEVYAAHPDTPLDAFLASLDPMADYPQSPAGATECPPEDLAAATWGCACRSVWDWERIIRGRDRWDEMSKRGAQVHPSLVETSVSRDRTLKKMYVFDGLATSNA